MTQSPFLESIRSELRTRRYSLQTEKVYLYWIKGFILFNDKQHANKMGNYEIERYLNHLAVNRQVSAAKNKNGQTHDIGQDILSEPGLLERRNFNLEPEKVINLRSFKASDEYLLLLYLNNKEVTQYITNAIAQPYTISDAKWWLNTGCKSDHIKAIEYKGVFVGCISATIGNFEYNRSAELGYWLGQEYWNRGIATEVVKEFSELLFRTTNITRLFVSVVSQNTASIRVLEKNGFKFEGLLEKASFKNNQFYDECLLSKIG